MKKHVFLLYWFAFMVLLCSGCYNTTRVDNSRGRPTHYEGPASSGTVAGVGIESQDIVSITDRMMRDILATPAVASRSKIPRVVMDSAYFRNESSSRINRNMITDLLRTELNRAAAGRLIFLARHHADMTEKERRLEEEDFVTGGTQGEIKSALGYDYRLGGRITSLDAVNSKTGVMSRYHQITFELIERGTGVIVWSNNYEFKKSAQDDIIYR